MKNVILKKLKLVNFKGAEDMELNMHSDFNVDIYGANGSKKTTILDAFTWLFTGKDSQGRLPNSGKDSFELKTLDSDNNVIHNLDHTVYADYLIDGNLVSFSRSFKEQWRKERNSGELILKGHETAYSINNVPMKKSDFEMEISKLITDVSNIVLISDPRAFCSLPWTKCRQLLLDVSGQNETEQELIKSNQSLDGLIELTTNKSVLGLLKEKKATLSKLKSEIKEIPIKIKENNTNMPSSLDWESISLSIKNKEQEILNIEKELKGDPSIMNEYNNLLINLNGELNTLKLKIQKIESDAQIEFNRRINEKTEGKKKIEIEINNLELSIKALENNKSTTNSELNEMGSKYKEIRLKYTEESNTSFNAQKIICPLTKSECQADEVVESEIDKLNENFNRSKAETLKTIVANAEKLKKEGISLKKLIAEYEEKLSLKNKSLAEKKEELANYDKNAEKLVTKQCILKSNTEYPTLKDSEKALIDRISGLVKPSDNLSYEQKQSLSFKIGEIKNEIKLLNTSLLQKTEIEKIKTRNNNLQQEMSIKGQEISNTEKIIDLCNSFIEYKIGLLDRDINSKFGAIKFKFFKEQMNGELDEICEPLVDGVPWKSANNAAQLFTGIEIINMLRAHFGVSMPIIIDNRESVTSIPSNLPQVINLRVYNDESMSSQKEVADYHKWFKEEKTKQGNIFLK